MSNQRLDSGNSAPDYQVFLNFRGKDTRDLIDIIRHFLVQSGIRVFYDDESLRQGDVIDKELHRAIERSNVYVVMLSKRYAESKWCLRELTHMVRCWRKESDYGPKVILPAFYDVSVETVKLKDGSYRGDMERLLASNNANLTGELRNWENALVTVAKLKGLNKGNTGAVDFSQMIVKEVQSRLLMRPLSYQLLGIDKQVQDVKEKLEVESGDVSFLVINGESGMGKTTLARTVFLQISARFQGSSFIADVSRMEKRYSYLHLQHRLLMDIYGDNVPEDISSLLRDKKILSCRDKQVLIVLDGVERWEQIEKLVGSFTWFGPGSRIIITSSFLDRWSTPQNMLKPNSDPERESLFFKMKKLQHQPALELFNRYAFWRNLAWENYDTYSRQIVGYSDNLPLILEIMGSFLHGKRETKEWKYIIDELTKCNSVGSKLMIIYKKLQPSTQKIFLDIACFFVNEEKTNAEYMWDYPEDIKGIKELLMFSLVKIVDGNKLWMHDSLSALGRHIVCRFYDGKLNGKVCENSDCEPLEESSRFWEHKEALEALQYKKDKQKVEAICPERHGGSQANRSPLVITDREFSRKPKLRFLKWASMKFSGDFGEHLRELRWLSLHYSPDEFEATNFASAVLVILDLAYSSITGEWNGWAQIKEKNNLKVIDLTGCEKLTKMPILSSFKGLERLILEGCKELAEIDRSIGDLTALKFLNIRGCDSIEELPREICSVTTLEEILIMKNGGRFSLPSDIGSLKSLTALEIVHVEMKTIPETIGNLEKLQRLSLLRCSGFNCLPHTVGKLKSLAELQISRTEIISLPESIGLLKKLNVIKMEHSSITGLPRDIGKAEKLEEIYGKNSQKLGGEIPDEIQDLCHLKVLDLSGTSVKKLPKTISQLSCLQKLLLPACCELQNLSELPKSLSILGITLREMPQDRNPLGELTELEKLELIIIKERTKLCAPFEFPHGLSTLHLSFEVKQHNFKLPAKLSRLVLKKALVYTALGQLKDFEKLSFLELQDCQFKDSTQPEKELQDCQFKDSTQPENVEPIMLMHFSASGCEFAISNGLHLPKDLRGLILTDCTFQNEVLQLSHLERLERLEISKCEGLEVVDGIEKLASLTELRVRGCPSLKVLRVDKLKSQRLKVLSIVDNDELECEMPDEAYCRKLEVFRCIGPKLYSSDSSRVSSRRGQHASEFLESLSEQDANEELIRQFKRHGGSSLCDERRTKRSRSV